MKNVFLTLLISKIIEYKSYLVHKYKIFITKDIPKVEKFLISKDDQCCTKNVFPNSLKNNAVSFKKFSFNNNAHKSR